MCLLMAASLGISAHASSVDEWTQHWGEVVANEKIISLSPGADDSEMRFCWLAGIGDKDTFTYGCKPDLSDGSAAKIERVLTAATKVSCRVTISGLAEKSTYYYRRNDEKIFSFSTGTSDSLQVLMVSDSQIGRSGDWKKDEVIIHDLAGWDDTLKAAQKQYPKLGLIVSAGDQVEIGASDKQYKAFLAPEVMRSLPIATTIGNHEFYFPYLTWRFNNPNRWGGEVFQSLSAKGYYFTKGDALFIVLNSNNLWALEQEALIEAAIKSYPDAKWRVAVMHHSIYSCEGPDNEMPSMRKNLAPIFDKYNINLVFSGHSHKYSRSYPMKDFTAMRSGGTVYLESGCSSTSNCRSGPETVPAYTQFTNKNNSPVYSVLGFSDDGISIESYNVVEGESVLIDSATVQPTQRDDTNAHMSGFMTTIYKLLSKFTEIKRYVFDILR